MYTPEFREQLQETIRGLQDEGLYKLERTIESPQEARIELEDGRSVLNFCANNYLGLANHPEVINAAKRGLDERGYGMASVRFICGTQDRHKELEARLSRFLGMEDTILFAACFDANGGVFEPLFGPEDAIISDQLNHASIIDGVRLCKAQRFRYKNNDMADLEAKLQEACEAKTRHRIIATDGVFSMDGYIAKLQDICELAEKYNALVMVDDCHATGFMGKTGRGTHEYHGVMDKIDIMTGTLGKALGGASGGYVTGRREIIDLLRQRSRPYLFSNTLAPSIVEASLKVLDLLEESTQYRDQLWENTEYYREGLKELGMTIKEGEHPIVPIMIGDAARSQKIAGELLVQGVYVVGFFYPVVPRGEARIRTQVSAAHSRKNLDYALEQWGEMKRMFGV